MIYLRLFFEFFRTGLFAVGGGLATLPFLYDMSIRTGWFSQAQLSDMIAVSESTPGPMGVNMATYVGFTTAGIPGALCATIGLIAPSIIVILLIAVSLKAFRDNPYVEAAFYGLRPASTGLIAASGVSVLVMALWNSGANTVLSGIKGKGVVLFVVLLLLTRWCPKVKDLHPIVFIVASAAVGIVCQFA